MNTNKIPTAQERSQQDLDPKMTGVIGATVGALLGAMLGVALADRKVREALKERALWLRDEGIDAFESVKKQKELEKKHIPARAD